MLRKEVENMKTGKIGRCTYMGGERERNIKVSTVTKKGMEG